MGVKPAFSTRIIVLYAVSEILVFIPVSDLFFRFPQSTDDPNKETTTVNDLEAIVR